MFTIYTIVGELEAETADDVLDLLARYPFKAAQDFFTVSRDHADYLEILKSGRKMSIGYIAEGADDSVALGEDVTFELVKRVAAAYCRDDPQWQDLLGVRPTAKPSPSPVYRESPTRESIHAEVDQAFHISGEGIKPKTVGCAPVWVVIVLLGLGLLGYTLFPLIARYFGP